jgi:PII-like signaling protein
MTLSGRALLARIFLGEGDKIGGRPAYVAIVEEARRRSIRGATVLRGIMGYGAGSRIHIAAVLRLSEDLPIVVELVDEEARIRGFLPWLEEVLGGGLVTLEKVEVIRYESGRKG